MSLHLPQEFENYMKVRLGPGFDNFQSSLEQAPPVSIRLNPEKSISIKAENVPWTECGRYLPERPSFTLDPRFHAGAYYVQEASSMFVEQAVKQSVDLKKTLTVLDLCAAPGGKSTHLLSLISKESLLISNEVIRSRASILSENLQKWGYDNVIVTNNDPADFERLPNFFDLILTDAPCSGEGLFRKDPEAMKEWSLRNVEMCSLRQQRIISDIWSSLKPGGVLIYSTCTYNESENTENLLWLKANHDPDFISLKTDPAWGVETLKKGACVGYQFFPHQVKGEGFFLSVIRKKEDNFSNSIRSKDTLSYPSKIQLQEFSSWITKPEDKCFFLHHQNVRMMHASKKPELQLALHKLNVLTAGTGVLEIMKNKFVPDPSLAWSININKESFHRIPLPLDQALEYLRKNTQSFPDEPIGFALIEFEGLGLGWVNVLQNRANNLYPANWRIKMGPSGPTLH